MQKKALLKIVKASAGSGKTFSLTVHYLTLLLHKESSYREILAVTFTNKATAEMKHRILQVLQGLASGSGDAEIVLYRAKLVEENPDWSDASIQEKAQRIYRQILHDYSRFTVSTIDGFSQKVIRSFTYELNLDSGYVIEMNTNKVKKELTLMLNELLDDRPDLLDWIIQYAEQKISQNENWNYRQQLMDLARLIFSENFQEFDQHLAVSDPQIFDELNDEIEEKTKVFVSTLQQALDTFRAHYQTLGIDSSDMYQKTRNKLVRAGQLDFKINKLSVSDIQDLIFTPLIDLLKNEEPYLTQTKEVRYDLKDALRPTLEAIQQLQEHFANYIAYKAVEANLYYLRLLKEMSDLLGRWRKQNGAQLISDAQILLSRLGLDQNSDPTFIWEKIGNRYRYFLFDEFQDTSRIQWKNYSPLLLNAMSYSTGKINEHLIVGDVKQSIYRWRNGDWRILLQQVEHQVRQTFHLNPEISEQFIESATLDTNYRSLPNIIELNNFLFEHIPAKMQEVLNQKVEAEIGEQGLDWWRSSGNSHMLTQAYQNSRQLVPAEKLGPDKPQGSIDIQYFPVENGSHRPGQVRDITIENLCQTIGDWLTSGRYTPGQIGILVRRNAEANLIIDALMRYKHRSGLDFDVVSGEALSLHANQAVQLILETMRALAFQTEKHVIHRANMVYLYQTLQEHQPISQDIWLRIKTNRLDQLTSVLPDSLIEEWEHMQKIPLTQLLEKLITIYQLGEQHSKHLPYLLALKDIVTHFSSKGERGLVQFLDYWNEDGEKAVLPTNGDIQAIEVTTIHKSKGLAYDVVMLPFPSWSNDGMPRSNFWIDVDQTPFHALGKIPVIYTKTLANSAFYQQYYEEMLFNFMDALNTFYVAMTRARKHIYLSAPMFSQKVDKKTKTVALERKDAYISDILYQVLEQDQSPFPLTEARISVSDHLESDGQNHPQPQVNQTSSRPPILSLVNYPTSEVLSKAFKKSASRDITQILSLSGAARYGLLAHEVISQVQSEAEIAAQVAKFLEEGILNPEEVALLRDEISAIWNHPMITKWLNGSYKIWSESSIITADGHTLRPDKVFTSEEESIVLDFKFTKGDYIDHKTQIAQYMNALHQVGYRHIKGYLYYAKTRELVEVI
ncbi:MAG: UvrD-helicase domain-containing protein [Sphingobacterium sp.]